MAQSKTKSAKPCVRCRGTGHEPEPRWLYPRDPEDMGAAPPYSAEALARVVPSTTDPSTWRQWLHFGVGGAASIFEACRAAKEEAEQSLAAAAFDFNGIVVVVGPDDDAEAIGREWWQAAYKCTPEETMERR